MKTLRILYVLMILLFSAQLSLAQKPSCTASACHNGLVNLKNVHAPVTDDCSACHQASGKTHPGSSGPEFSLTAPLAELCYQCHESKTDMDVIHGPLQDGDCMSCHNAHGSLYSHLLKENNVCASCHEIDMQAGFVHGPVAGQMCNACHDPHQAEFRGLLRRSGHQLCLFCHSEKRVTNESVSVHAPFEGDCLDCHRPHVSEAKYLLNREVPALCFDCHEAVEVRLDRKSEVHGPFQKGGKCYLCHNAHVSRFSHLLQDEEQNLCFTCHDRTIEKEGKTIKNIAARVKNAKMVHGPIEGEGCSACHAAHSPDNYFLLSAAFPEGSYSEGKVENFAHCFDCHDSALMKEQTTTKATGFRNGQRNLHYVHVHREKARNCTTCHDTHGSDNAHLIAATVPFGNWEMPMNYTETEEGGSCLTGCHAELAYSRN